MLATVVTIIALFVLTSVNLFLIYMLKKHADQIAVKVYARLMREQIEEERCHGADKKLKQLDLLYDLCLHLIPLKAEMDVAKVDTVGRKARLSRERWPEQAELGIKRACGFELIWED